jgi:3-dehydroquinate synthetase
MWRDAIARGAAVKARIVRADPTEQAERVTLNFGHTFGHAIEAQGGLDRWTHGEAVAIGMVLAARVGELLGVTPPEVVSRLERCIRRVGLPTEVAASDLRAAAAFVSSDKKREGQAIRFVLLEELGRPVVRRIPFEELETLLRRLVR